MEPRVNMSTCPKCNAIAKECTATECEKCGIIFTKYFFLRKKKFIEALDEIGQTSLLSAEDIFKDFVHRYPEGKPEINDLTFKITTALKAKESGNMDEAERQLRAIKTKYLNLKPAIDKELEKTEAARNTPTPLEVSIKPKIISKKEPHGFEQHEKQGQESEEKTTLIECPTCTKNVSPNAVTCPHCGEPLQNVPPISLFGQEPSHLAGLAGTIILVIGVFCPIISAPIIGDINLFQNGKGDGVILLIFAGVSFLYLLKKEIEPLFMTGIGSAGLLCFTFYNIYSKISNISSNIEKDLAGNPFRGLADTAIQSIQMQWGWGILIVGSSLLVTAGILERRKNFTASMPGISSS